ncbi:MAG: YjjG family noncanonical pyrimidine nucleotidase [Flavobacteriales bacterium]|nr:YjjG family noncanonical pyrimidine nucleotidase [Flavobacteriales bacterium]
MKDVEHIFFDLDHTLWDFDRNSSETLAELFESYKLGDEIESSETFIAKYQEINNQFWKLYREGKIEKAKLRYIRFMQTFEIFGLKKDQKFAEQFAADYLEVCPHKTNVFPGTFETLEHLAGKYPLHIITNGFKEVQGIKMEKSGLGKYFDLILSSEDVGVNKPDPRVFNRALELTNASHNNSVMIGDTYEADIVGAENVGMKAILFNPSKANIEAKTNQIYHLTELIDIFA